jgi:DNA-binding SARP family transcriptional activator/basic membrane lipoprotein Med (substrate-binding protein (PBP1-ABC) superfamily)
VTSQPVEFRVLGPLEMSLGGEQLALGGAKQRAVLAVLLLRAGEVVPVGRLIDEVWGDDPPPSAAHTLESYVSRLRQLFNGHGPLLVRRGAGYALELGAATLDARGFVESQERASLAAAIDQHDKVVELTGAALATWRGPALADVALASAGRAEADRLEELRLRTYELRFDAELALGSHEQAIAELQALVSQNPYRERFVAQLMLALYRCGRHADALETYEQTRRRLDDDLGLQPSGDLQQLSGQIVRQDPALRRPSVARQEIPQDRPIRRRSRRIAELVLVGSLVAAIMALTASGSSSQRPAAPPSPQLETTSGGPASADAARVAIVVPSNAPERSLAMVMGRVVSDAEGTWDLDGALLQADDTDSRQMADLVRRIQSGRFALVVVVGDGPLTTQIVPVVRQSDGTKFIFLDASLADLGLDGEENALGIRFANEHTSQLMGYLSAMAPTRRDARARADVVSVISGPGSPQQDRVIAGFEEGASHARPNLSVLVGHVTDTSDPTECERLANEQIDQGSDVLFAVAGPCGLGAIAVARIRGVWAVGASEDGVELGPSVLATSYEERAEAAFAALQDFAANRISFGQDLVRGLGDAYAVGIDTNRIVSDKLWSKVVLECSKIRQRAAAGES